MQIEPFARFRIGTGHRIEYTNWGGGGASNSINVCSPPDFGKIFTKSTDKNRQNRQKLFFCALN